LVSIDRKEAIRNKMMILDKEFAKSRILLEQSQSDNKFDEFSSQYFKMREEPQSIRFLKNKNEFENGDSPKIDEETRKN